MKVHYVYQYPIVKTMMFTNSNSISSKLRNDSNYILEGLVEFKIYLNYRL